MDAGPISKSREPPVPWRPEGCDNVALVLQGGGALGAYQAGAYEALHEAGLAPDWVAGVSIGAINGAIIAGNPPSVAWSKSAHFGTPSRRDRFR
jgi:NTE family protein